MAAVGQEAVGAGLAALRPGALAREVYAAWQAVVDRAGLGHYRRHHCGYAVGIGMPPSWTGGNSVTGLRSDGDMALRSGMTFHILSWLMGAGQMGAGIDPVAARDKILLVGLTNDVSLRSEEHTSELQSLMRISYAVFCL